MTLRCNRCHGRVGDPSCGKSIHATMEAKIGAVIELGRELGSNISREDAIKEVRTEEDAAELFNRR